MTKSNIIHTEAKELGFGWVHVEHRGGGHFRVTCPGAASVADAITGTKEECIAGLRDLSAEWEEAKVAEQGGYSPQSNLRNSVWPTDQI